MATDETCRPAGRPSETSDEPSTANLTIRTGRKMNMRFTSASSLVLLRLQLVVVRAIARAFQTAKMDPRVDPLIV